MSQVAQRIAGVFVEDAPPPSTAVIAWVQEECRHGRFSKLLASFAKSQAENPNSQLALVESVSPDTIVGRIPCFVTDHESPHPLTVDVGFRLNPMDGSVLRVIGGGV